MLYSELKDWFETNAKGLPDTLDGGFIYYHDVKAYVRRSILQIESLIEKHGKRFKRYAQARAARANLQTLYNHLQNTEKWDVPKPKRKSSSNRMDIFFDVKRIKKNENKETALTYERLKMIEDLGTKIDYDRRIIFLPAGFSFPKSVEKNLKFIKDKGWITERIKE